MTEEGKIVKAIKTFLKARKVKFLRLTMLPGAEVGWPDFMICGRGGLPLFLEVKKPGETPKAIQTFRMTELSDRGYLCNWSDTEEGCLNIIKDYLILCTGLS